MDIKNYILVSLFYEYMSNSINIKKLNMCFHFQKCRTIKPENLNTLTKPPHFNGPIPSFFSSSVHVKDFTYCCSSKLSCYYYASLLIYHVTKPGSYQNLIRNDLKQRVAVRMSFLQKSEEKAYVWQITQDLD